MTTVTGSRLGLVRLTRLVTFLGYAFVLVAEAILLLGFFLKLFGANPTAPFAEWTYRNLDRVMAPFRGIFEEITFEDSASVLDVSILFAMVVYGLLALAIRALLDWLELRATRLERKQFLEAAAAEQEMIAANSPTLGIPATPRAPTAGVTPAPPQPSAGAPTPPAPSTPSPDADRVD